MMRWIVVGNSPEKTFSQTYLYQTGDKFIGLDGGAMAILEKGFSLEMAIGDFDSTDQYSLIASKAITIHKYPIEKDQTDLELVFLNVNCDAPMIFYDVLGGRKDHELVAIWLLHKYQSYQITIYDAGNCIQYLTKGRHIIKHHPAYQSLSFLAMEQSIVSTYGTKYNIVHAAIDCNTTYTTSNEIIANYATIDVEQGGIFLIRSKIVLNKA